MASGPVFKIAGIPVRIEPVFFAVILFLGIFNPPQFIITWAVIATISILLHEFGHAIAFRLFGLQPRITLHAFGGLTSATSTSSEAPFTPIKSIITSLAGPLSAVILFGVPALLIAYGQGFDPWLELRQFRPPGASAAAIILSQIIYINLGWSLLNLIPVLPLDGGNVTASVCELASPRLGRRVANVISIGAAAACALLAYPHVGLLAPVFAAMFIGLNVRELMNVRAESDDEQLRQATRALLDYDPARAEQLARAVVVRDPTGSRLGWARELCAWCRLAIGDLEGCRRELVALPAGSGPSASIRGALALAEGKADEGVSVLAWAFTHDTARSAKVFGAIAAAQSGRAEAVARELVLLGPEGIEAARLFQSLLDYAGHRAEAQQVGRLVEPSAPRPPGW